MIFYTITGTMPVKPDWSGISGILKAGTPISVRGAISNDDGAVGLVAADTAHGAETVLAVIAGVVDLAEASASYGSAISDDVVQALDNVAFLYGGKVYGVSGSSLPDYSEASDGDVLSIDNGTPAWTTPSGGGGSGDVLNVTITKKGNTLTADKTYAEIDDAFTAGAPIVVCLQRLNNSTSAVEHMFYAYEITKASATSFKFSFIEMMSISAGMTDITITESSILCPSGSALSYSSRDIVIAGA